MSKHTPGDWKVDPRCSTHVIADQGPQRLARPICSTGGYQDNCADSKELLAENEANARLIAAAKRMRELLKRMTKWREDDFDPFHFLQNRAREARALLEELDNA